MYVEKEHIIKEILETEKKYVADLNSLVNVYQKPLEKSGVISEASVKTIFKNLNIIININANLCTQLQNFYGTFPPTKSS